MSSVEQALIPDTGIARANYDDPWLCPLPQYHPEILATRLALKRSATAESMRTFGQHQARAAAERRAQKIKEEAQKRQICMAVWFERDSTQNLDLDPEDSALLLLGRLASTMKTMLETKSY